MGPRAQGPGWLSGAGCWFPLQVPYPGDPGIWMGVWWDHVGGCGGWRWDWWLWDGLDFGFHLWHLDLPPLLLLLLG